MQVLNIEAFMPIDAYQRGVRAFLDSMKTIPASPDVEEILVPGDVEQRARIKNLRDGIEVPDTIYSQLQDWAARLNATIETEVDVADRKRYQP
jgi:LDH2 family malate/lactate/ureidoglycolate dehydrogenase